jgi:hypothetical protein
MTKNILAAAIAALALCAGPVLAADSGCAAKAAEKKLSGAAKASFIKKCERDSAPAVSESCTKAADEKKLHGAARTSFVKKCTADEAASAPKK